MMKKRFSQRRKDRKDKNFLRELSPEPLSGRKYPSCQTARGKEF